MKAVQLSGNNCLSALLQIASASFNSEALYIFSNYVLFRKNPTYKSDIDVPPSAIGNSEMQNTVEYDLRLDSKIRIPTWFKSFVWNSIWDDYLTDTALIVQTDRNGPHRRRPLNIQTNGFINWRLVHTVTIEEARAFIPPTEKPRLRKIWNDCIADENRWLWFFISKSSRRQWLHDLWYSSHGSSLRNRWKILIFIIASLSFSGDLKSGLRKIFILSSMFQCRSSLSNDIEARRAWEAEFVAGIFEDRREFIKFPDLFQVATTELTRYCW